MGSTHENSTDSRVPKSNEFGPALVGWWIFRALASMQLAVVLIFVLTLVLIGATLLESKYGYQSKAAHYGIYGAKWFVALNGLLALNVLCSALSRLPWKRRHIGFLITHAGILVLLFGFLLSSLHGIDANLPVFEGEANWQASEDSQSFHLSVLPEKDEEDDEDSAEEAETIVIPFVSGPFNWDDYNRKAWFPWGVVRRDKGVVYDRDGVKLEVLDYYSDSTEVSIPRVRLKFRRGKALRGQLMSGDSKEALELEFTGTREPNGPGRGALSGGENVVFWAAESKAETDAFRQSAPEGPLGDDGQIVLFAAGEKFVFPVESFKEKPRQPLGETGVEVELVHNMNQMLGLQLGIHHKDGEPSRMMLMAAFPELNRQDREHGVFGTYWFDPTGKIEDPEKSHASRMLQRAAMPRIDVLQGANEKLYYRAWKAPKLEAIDRLPTGGKKVALFEGTDDALTMSVDEFISSLKPAKQQKSLPFSKDRSLRKQRRAQVRLTVDGNSEEFWLAGWSPDMKYLNNMAADVKLPPPFRFEVEGKDRSVAITMPRDVVSLGFQVYLHQFYRELDPGSHMVSRYSSRVDFCERDEGDGGRRTEVEDLKPLETEVLIDLNAPAVFQDPRTGRSYRLYQSSFQGPLKPGSREFFDRAGRDIRDQIFISFFSVNYDPGRGMKYLGSFMICFGIAAVFYMRRFLNRKRRKQTQQPDPRGPAPDRPSEKQP